MKKSNIRSHFFTLLEIFMVISILLIIGSLFGNKFFQLLHHKRFIASSNQIETQVDVCKKLAKIYQEDVELTIVQQKKGIEYQINQVGKQNFLQNIPSSKKFVSDIFCLIDGQPFEKKIICFSSSGKVIPEGVFEICSKTSPLSTKIDFAKISFIEEKGNF